LQDRCQSFLAQRGRTNPRDDNREPRHRQPSWACRRTRIKCLQACRRVTR
jgi:hypothetical protein